MSTYFDLAHQDLPIRNPSDLARGKQDTSRGVSSFRVHSRCECIWSREHDDIPVSPRHRQRSARDYALRRVEDFYIRMRSERLERLKTRAPQPFTLDSRTRTNTPSAISSSGPPVITLRDPACPVHTSALPLQSYEVSHFASTTVPDSTPTTAESSFIGFDYHRIKKRAPFPVRTTEAQSSEQVSHHPPLILPTWKGDKLASPVRSKTQTVDQETFQSATNHDIKEENLHPEDLLLEDAPITSPSPAETQTREATPSTDSQPNTSCDEEMSDNEDRNSMDETLSKVSLPDNTATTAAGSPDLSTRAYVEQNMPSDCRMLFHTLLDIIEAGNLDGSDVGNDLTDGGGYRSEDSSTLANEGRPRDASDAPETGGSRSRSTFPAGGSGHPPGSKRPHSPARDDSGAGGNDDGRSPKEPNHNQGSSAKRKKSGMDQPFLPCPGRIEMSDGTWTRCCGDCKDVSQLIRELLPSHEVVVCPKCYEVRNFAKNRAEANTFKEQHKDCKEKCVSKSKCRGSSREAHMSTPNCPSKNERKGKLKYDIWEYIWEQLNPGQKPPPLVKSNGTSYTHSDQKIPRSQRGNSTHQIGNGEEAVMNLAVMMNDQEKDIKSLEDKIRIRDEIILGFLGHYITRGIPLEILLQKRIYNECRDLWDEAHDYHQHQQSPRQVSEPIAIANPINYPPTPHSAQQGIALATPSQIPSQSITASGPSNDSLSSQSAYRLDTQCLDDLLAGLDQQPQQEQFTNFVIMPGTAEFNI